jgi:hypothetical protein
MNKTYTEMTSKFWNLSRRRPEFEPCEASLEQLNLKSLAPGSPMMHRRWGGVQAGSNSVAIRRRQKPNFEVVSLYICLIALAISSLAANEEETACEPGPKPHQIRFRHLESEGIGFHQGYSTLEAFLSSSNLWWEHLIPYLDLRGHVFNDGKFAANIGIGDRYLFSSGCHAIGSNLYYDYRKTHHKSYHQIGAGLEYLTPFWEMRANGYFPIAGTVSKHFDPAFDRFSGHNFYFKVKHEFAMTGGDAEIGWHFKRVGPFDFFAAVGPYYFKGDLGDAAIGGKLRVVIELSKYCTLEGSDSYDSVFHNRIYGQLSINIPFGPKTKVEKYTSCSCKKQLMLQEWIHEPPARDEIIVVDTKHRSDKAIDPATGEPYFFWFVNNTSSSLGTYESPFPTLVSAQNASKPGDVIYVFPGDGTSNNMNMGIVLQNNQRFLGSATSHEFLTSLGTIEISPQSANAPIITNSGTIVNLSNNNEVSGFVIVGGTAGISAGGNWTNVVTTANINRNQILNTVGDGIQLALMNSQASVSIQGNTIIQPSSYGVQFICSGSSGANLHIEDNFISNAELGNVLVQSDMGSNVDASVTSNTLYLYSFNLDPLARVWGVHAQTLNDSVLISNISNNTIWGGVQSGFASGAILVEAVDVMTPSSRTETTIVKNVIIQGGSGIVINTDPMSLGSMQFAIDTNNISYTKAGFNTAVFGSAVAGSVGILQQGTGICQGGISNNALMDQDVAGIHVINRNPASFMNLDITNNNISNCPIFSGIRFNCHGSATANISSNQIDHVSNVTIIYPALEVIGEGNISCKLHIANNRFSDNMFADFLAHTETDMVTMLAGNLCLKLEGNQSQNGYTIHNTPAAPGVGVVQLEPLDNNVGGFSFGGIITHVPAGTCD